MTAGTIEHITINGQGGNDSLNMVAPSPGPNTITLTPGSAVDSGAIQVGALVPLDYNTLGATGSVTFSNSGSNGLARVDTLVYNGTSASDTFAVSSAGAVTLNNQIPVNTPGIVNLNLFGLSATTNSTSRVACRSPPCCSTAATRLPATPPPSPAPQGW